MWHEPEMSRWVFALGALACIILYRHRRKGWGVGLVLTYVFCFVVLHWFAPLLRLLPWFEPADYELTAEGLRQSTFALAGFLVGLEIVGAWYASRADDTVPRGKPAFTSRLVTFYLAAGVALYLVVPLAGQLPSIGAIVSTGSTLVAVGVGLKCWHALQAGQRGRMLLWLALATLFPIVTVLTQGFLGYGFVAVLIVLAFVASQYPLSWRSAAVGLVLVYAGLSIYVTYMRDRGDIREVVWRGEAIERRIEQLENTFQNVEWFDPREPGHLERVDARLNQNYLIGAAVVYIGEGNVALAKGGTLVDAVAAVIPRAIWPDKPIVGGSGDLVTNYTGIYFMQGTSVGVGQVMEFFVNFGTPGVLMGFVLIGALVTLVDRRAGEYLGDENIHAFALWYIPGLSLLQIGGSLAEVSATAGASLVVVLMVSRFSRPLDAEAPPEERMVSELVTRSGEVTR